MTSTNKAVSEANTFRGHYPRTCTKKYILVVSTRVRSALPIANSQRLGLLWGPQKEKNGQITALFSIIIKCTITMLYPAYGDMIYISTVRSLGRRRRARRTGEWHKGGKTTLRTLGTQMGNKEHVNTYAYRKHGGNLFPLLFVYTSCPLAVIRWPLPSIQDMSL